MTDVADAVLNTATALETNKIVNNEKPDASTAEEAVRTTPEIKTDAANTETNEIVNNEGKADASAAEEAVRSTPEIKTDATDTETNKIVNNEGKADASAEEAVKTTPEIKADAADTEEAARKAAIVPEIAPPKKYPSAIPTREDNLTYSLKDLAAFDITPIMQASLVEETSRDNIQFLVNRIFALPTVTSDWGRCAVLPEKATFALPREKPLPSVAPKTRWDKFAQERGIHKKKRGRMVWDPTIKDWAPRFGYKSVKKNEEKANWAIEVKEGEDPYENPFDKQKAEKTLVVAKQKMRQLRNKVEAIGEKLPAGVTDFSEHPSKRHRGKDNLKEALRRAQISSASFGTFDKKAENEVKVKQPHRNKIKSKPAKDEKSGNLKLLSRMEKSGIDKKKAANIGQVAEEKKNRSTKKVKKTSKRPSKNGKRSKGGGKGGKKG